MGLIDNFFENTNPIYIVSNTNIPEKCFSCPVLFSAIEEVDLENECDVEDYFSEWAPDLKLRSLIRIELRTRRFKRELGAFVTLTERCSEGPIKEINECGALVGDRLVNELQFALQENPEQE